MAELTDADVAAIKADWSEFTKDMTVNMVLFYQNLFRNYPKYLKYFDALDGVDVEDMQSNPYMRDIQGRRAGVLLNKIIENLGDAAATKANIGRLAKSPAHIKMGMEKEDYANSFTTLVFTLHQLYGKEKVASQSWGKLAQAALSLM